MKKNIALLFLSIFVLASCAKKDIVVNETEVTLHHGETYQITAESHNPITYVSEDRYHAEVNSGGVVTAVCVGETNIKLSNGNDEKKVHVIVTPTNFCITEPDIAFGDSKSSVLEKLGEPDYEEDGEDGETAMIYLYTDYAMIMMVMLDENDMVVATGLGGMANIASDMSTFLSERYYYLGLVDFDGDKGDTYINALTESEATVEIVHTVFEGQLSIALYSTPQFLNDNGLLDLFAKASQKIRK